MARRRPNAQGHGDSPVEFAMLPLEQLQFDATNPRIVERLGPRPGQRQIYNLLVNEEDARDLIPSFIENGYLPTDPLIVRAEHNGKYSVLEGNRRLAALQSMSASEDEEDRTAFEQKNLNELPCLIFRGGEDAELAYLGLRHISKTKDWSPAAKSAFVERLLRSGVSLTQAGRRTNTSPQALRQLLLTRRLFEKAVGLGIETPSIAAERDLVFWHLGDAVRRRRTKQYLEVEENDNPLLPPEVDEGKLEKLMTWIYGNPKTKQTKLITSIRDIPSLDLSLGNEKSIQALEAGATIQDALEAAEAAGAKVNAHLDRAKTSVQKATGTLSDIQRETFAEIDAARMSLTVAFEAFDRELAAARQRLGA